MFRKNSLTSFEQLPNETLFQIFDYLSYIDAINAFFSLNYRFNATVLQYNRSLRTFTTPMQENPFWQTILSTIRAQIKHLVINSTAFSLSLDSFPNLKSLVISSSLPLDYDELGVMMESEQFKRLVSLKIKSEIMKDISEIDKVSFHKILQTENSLRTFESLKEQVFLHRHMNYLRINTNLRSLSLKCLDLQRLSILLSHTPNLKYLNIVLSEVGADVNLVALNLKQCSVSIEKGKINEETFPFLTQFIKQFSSSLIELSLDLHQMRTEASVSTGLVLQQELLQDMVHLKSFHLYLQLDFEPLQLNDFLSTFQTPFWHDHQWIVGMHECYLYTLPFHFDTLHEFSDFDKMISSNTNVLESWETWSQIKSIEFSNSFKFGSDLNKQLKAKMPNLTSAILTFDLICSLSKSVWEMNHIDQKLDNITTIHCPTQCFGAVKDYLPFILPNIRYLMLSHMSFRKRTLRDPMVVSQELDTFLSDGTRLRSGCDPFTIKCVEIKVTLHETDGIYQDVVRLLTEILEISTSLELITFQFHHLLRSPSIHPYTALQEMIELFKIGTISQKYRIKHLRNYLQFVKKDVE